MSTYAYEPDGTVREVSQDPQLYAIAQSCQEPDTLFFCKTDQLEKLTFCGSTLEMVVNYRTGDLEKTMHLGPLNVIETIQLFTYLVHHRKIKDCVLYRMTSHGKPSSRVFKTLKKDVRQLMSPEGESRIPKPPPKNLKDKHPAVNANAPTLFLPEPLGEEPDESYADDLPF